MDKYDLAIIAQLRKNARASVSELARHIGLARTTVQARLQRLESSGAIAGYELKLGGDLERRHVDATVLLRVDSKNMPSVSMQLANFAEIRRARSSAGRYDMILMVETFSTEELDAVLDRIGAIDGVISSESLVHLSTKFNR